MFVSMAAVTLRGLLSRLSPIPYVKNVANDYAIVFRDLATEMRSRPLKTLFWTGVVFGGFYLYRTNPDGDVLEARLAELRQQLLLVPCTIQNPKAVDCLQRYTSMLNTHRVAHYDCLLFTLVVGWPHDRKSNLYATQDPNLRDWPWFELWNHIIDVGALNRFWQLEREFVDYDVRPDEFPDETVDRPAAAENRPTSSS